MDHQISVGRPNLELINKKKTFLSNGFCGSRGRENENKRKQKDK